MFVCPTTVCLLVAELYSWTYLLLSIEPKYQQLPERNQKARIVADESHQRPKNRLNDVWRGLA